MELNEKQEGQILATRESMCASQVDVGQFHSNQKGATLATHLKS